MILERIFKMAKAEQTKRTLASAMKKLLAQMPYEKVSVSMIAEEAGMNRKSFYYHFTGKSDLINWILDTEFREYLETTPEEEQGWEVMEMLASYFYRERLFYKTILLSTGYATLMNIMLPVISKYIRDMLEVHGGNDEFIVLASDGLLAAIFRWLLSPNVEKPDVFVSDLRCRITRLCEECLRHLR